MRSTQRRLFIPLIEERQSAAVRCGGLHLVSAARKASSAGRELTDKTASRTIGETDITTPCDISAPHGPAPPPAEARTTVSSANSDRQVRNG